jgi:HEAT repeat protein
VSRTGEHDLRLRLRDHDAVVRRQAARALGRAGKRDSVRDLLLVLAEDASAPVRRAAADALGRIGDLAARSALERTSRHDDDQAVRTAAHAALLKLLSASGETPAVLPTSRE